MLRSSASEISLLFVEHFSQPYTFTPHKTPPPPHICLTRSLDSFPRHGTAQGMNREGLVDIFLKLPNSSFKSEKKKIHKGQNNIGEVCLKG
jgi:hypothetical protein